jgi:integrase
MKIVNKLSVTVREKVLKDRTSLYIDIYHNGKRKKEFLNLYLLKGRENADFNRTQKKMAEEIRNQKLIELQSKKLDIPEFKPKFISLLDFINHYILKRTDLKKNTLKKTSSLKNSIVEFSKNSDIEFSEINKSLIDNFRIFLLRKYTSRNSADRIFSELKTVLNNAVLEEIIQFNPMDKVKGIGRERTLPKYLTIEEVRILKNTEYRNVEIKKAFLFACFTGLRFNDIKNLMWKNIINENNDYYIRFIQQKTNAEEKIFLREDILNLIGIVQNSNIKIFNLPNNENTNAHLKKWVKSAKIEKHVTFHVARHTYATMLLTEGANLKTVSELLGHTNIAPTQIYARVVNDLKKKAVNALPYLL